MKPLERGFEEYLRYAYPNVDLPEEQVRDLMRAFYGGATVTVSAFARGPAEARKLMQEIRDVNTMLQRDPHSWPPKV
jgi:hypothetical protein